MAEMFDAEEVAAMRRTAAVRRTAGDTALADVLERYAEQGLPDLAECTPWEELRDTHLASLGVPVGTRNVA